MERRGSKRFAEQISQALRAEFGGNPSSVKTVARLVNANERAVKNWFDAVNGPNGEFLIRLCRHSDQVLETVLLLSGRTELVKIRNILCAKEKLRQILALLEEIESANPDS
ncbi:transposase family protein [Thalassospira sp.]|uniref:transposase family protein n=1 Tax=Thalassospira sp. TaxID=1912094 RepID=UPI00273485E0|nr:transposase family protein [Thalassospira sp.]MDP2699278.1 transposase family protein [Thalassospira sp.]